MLLQRLYHLTKCSILQKSVISRSVHLLHKNTSNVQVAKTLWITSPFTLMGVWGLTENNNKAANTTIITRESILAKADALFDQGDYKSIYDALSIYKDSKDVEILWRLCRAIYNISKSASDVEAKKLICEGYDLISTALEIQEDHYAVHKWMCVFLDSKSNLEGIKARINQSHETKKHLLRAIELNPTDASTLYMLGCWCYEVANLTWYQQKIAALLFGVPPTSTYEEALMYYENAEKLDPNFYSHNLLMLGKTYLKLDRKEDAVAYLKKAAEFPARNDDDQKAKQEAQKILSSI